MNKSIKDILGSEYEVALAVEKDINELKQSDRMLLGGIIAIVNRSESVLGRPVEDCNKEEERKYVIFEPSYYSITCNKDFGSFRAKGSNYVLMSLNSFINKLLEFNLTYLQILYSNEIYYADDRFYDLRRYVNHLLTRSSLVDNNTVISSVIHGLASLACGVAKDLNNGKFKAEQIKNRIFLIYVSSKLCKSYIDSDFTEFVFSSCIDMNEYNAIMKCDDNAIKFVNKHVGDLTNFISENLDINFDLEAAKIFKIEETAKIMQDTIFKVLKEHK